MQISVYREGWMFDRLAWNCHVWNLDERSGGFFDWVQGRALVGDMDKMPRYVWGITAITSILIN
jgi:hypothetical protein